MSESQGGKVAIVGSGPVGLSLALGLARAGIRSIVVEKKKELDAHSRATFIHAKTLEILAQWKVLDDFLAVGERVSNVRVFERQSNEEKEILRFDFAALSDETEQCFGLAIPQDRTEQILLKAVRSTGMADVMFATEASGFEQSDRGVKVMLRSERGESQISAEYLAGADGAHSVVRKQLGLELNGKTYPKRALLADVRIDSTRDRMDAWPGILDERSFVVAIRFEKCVWRIIDTNLDDSVADSALPARIMERVERLFGPGPSEIIWQSAYHKHERRAEHFRAGRALLVGDAAHLNSPAGGQGMNSGIQDAHNLAWKLAASVADPEADAEALLDSYSQERIWAVDHYVQPFSDAMERLQTAPMLGRESLFRVIDKVFDFSIPQHWIARRLSMLATEYGKSQLLDKSNDRVGQRLPNPIAEDGKRIYQHIPAGGLLCARDDIRMRQLAEFVGLPLVRTSVPLLTTFFESKNFAALIRPDRVIGCLSENPSSALEKSEVRTALGKRPSQPGAGNHV